MKVSHGMGATDGRMVLIRLEPMMTFTLIPFALTMIVSRLEQCNLEEVSMHVSVTRCSRSLTLRDASHLLQARAITHAEFAGVPQETKALCARILEQRAARSPA